MKAPVHDSLGLDRAFALVPPRRVVQALREDRVTAHAAQNSVRQAVEAQPPAWREEFWSAAARAGLLRDLLD